MRVIDSHSEGEPTRVVLTGGPDLGLGPLSERLHTLATAHDDFRQAVILEPRGSDVLVGALLCPPVNQNCAAGVIFFNNTGYLGMCGHGTMGVAATLKHLGMTHGNDISIETPVGVVKVHMDGEHLVAVENVPSYLHQADVSVDVEGLGTVTGDVAWGGNWFFLVNKAPFTLQLSNCERLTQAAKRIKHALFAQQITGADGGEIDHIEFFADPISEDAHSRNFVLCPGDAYDRSPCGTGTSAKLACLAAKGQLQPGDEWIQESIIGSRFNCSYRLDKQERIIPTIKGRVFVSAESTLLFHAEDPFRRGITAAAL